MRKIHDEQDARRCLKAAESSSLSVTAWSRAHGVDARSLNAWRVNLARREPSSSASPTKARLVELVPTRSTEPSARYLVRVGDLAIELDDSFEEATLVRVVRALRSC